MKQYAGIILALCAGVLWGLMGIFVRYLSALGLGSMEIGEIRITFALLVVTVYLLLFHRELLVIRLRDLWCFFGSGVISTMLFCYTYFKAVQQLPLSVAAVLTYTSPIFVTLLSAWFFREPITGRSILALALSFGGCTLVCASGVEQPLSTTGILLGLLSGFVFSLYSVFSRFAILRGYRAWTITFYSFLLCALVGALFCDWSAIRAVMRAAQHWPYAMGLGICSGFVPYALYSLSLERIPCNMASVLISVEPVVATLISVWLFREPLAPTNIFGIVLVLSAVVVLARYQNEKQRRTAI